MPYPQQPTPWLSRVQTDSQTILFCSLNRKKISCKSVSISVVGMMSEPGTGYDNFQCNQGNNHDEADLIKVLDKRLLPPPLTFSSQEISDTTSSSAANNIKSNCASHSMENGESESHAISATTRRGRCRRYQKPLAVSFFALGFVLVIFNPLPFQTFFSRRWSEKMSPQKRGPKKKSFFPFFEMFAFLRRTSF